MPDSNNEITAILAAAKAGQPGATQRLFSLVYDELKKIAKNRISAGHHWSMHTTTLVHETYMRMVKKSDISWSDRHHFFWAAARAMKDILVERARHDAALKNGGGRNRQHLDDEVLSEPAPVDLIDLNDALDRLAKLHDTSAKIVELKFFAGLNREQIAEMLNISPSAVWREWSFAKAWLSNELGENPSMEKED